MVVPLNSNWSGIPDTLETETLETPGYAALCYQENRTASFQYGKYSPSHCADYQGELSWMRL